jgi:hypothetical protein
MMITRIIKGQCLLITRALIHLVPDQCIQGQSNGQPNNFGGPKSFRPNKTFQRNNTQGFQNKYDHRFSHHDGPVFQNFTPHKNVMPNPQNKTKNSKVPSKDGHMLQEFTYVDNAGVPRTGKPWVSVTN